MLIATPGQTASYALSAGTNRSTASTAAGTPKSITTANHSIKHNNNNNNNNNNNTNSSTAVAAATTTTTTTTATTTISNYKTSYNGKINTSIHNSYVKSDLISKHVNLNDKNYKADKADINIPTSNASTSLMKSLTIRLSRGTETLKATVQRALSTATSVTRGDIKAAPTLINKLKAFSNDIHVTNYPAATNTSEIAECSSSTLNRKQIKNTQSIVSNIANIPPTTFLQVYSATPTWTHRFPNKRHSSSDSDSGSVDSLRREMCHFKPIRAAPITPNKSSSKSRGPGMHFPHAVNAAERKPSCHINQLKPQILKQNTNMANSKSILDIAVARSSHSLIGSKHISAFVCLFNKMEELNNQPTSSNNNYHNNNDGSQRVAANETKEYQERTKAVNKSRTIPQQTESTNSSEEFPNENESVIEEMDSMRSPTDGASEYDDDEEDDTHVELYELFEVRKSPSNIFDGIRKLETNKRRDHQQKTEKLSPQDQSTNSSAELSASNESAKEAIPPAKRARRSQAIEKQTHGTSVPSTSRNTNDDVIVRIGRRRTNAKTLPTKRAAPSSYPINSNRSNDVIQDNIGNHKTTNKTPATIDNVKRNRKLPQKKTSGNRNTGTRSNSTVHNNNNNNTEATISRRRLPKYRLSARSSPPLTRARLKKLNEQNKTKKTL